MGKTENLGITLLLATIQQELSILKHLDFNGLRMLNFVLDHSHGDLENVSVPEKMHTTFGAIAANRHTHI